MSIKIIDNFLPNDYFEKLQSTILGPFFPWHFNNGIVSPYDENFQFTHMFYGDFEPKSNYFGMIFPIIEKFNPSSIVRSKANLLVKTDQLVQYDFHSDHHDCITAILYVNSNNGKTIFKDGNEVESVANRMVIFDSNIEHTGTSCTDEKIRVVINFNYHI